MKECDTNVSFNLNGVKHNADIYLQIFTIYLCIFVNILMEHHVDKNRQYIHEQ